MGDGKRRVLEEESPAYLPQGDEKSWDEFRGTLNRGLIGSVPEEKPEAIYDFVSDPDGRHGRNVIIGCTSAANLRPLSENPTRKEILGFLSVMTMGQLATFSETACLFRFASLAQQSLSNALLATYPEAYFDLVERLLEIRKEVEKRTQAPYETAFFRSTKPLPKEVLDIEPLPQYKQWEALLKDRKQILAGSVLVLEPIPLKEPVIEVKDKKGWQETLAKLEKNIQAQTVDVLIRSARVGATPTINGHLANLKLITFKEIERQTGVKMRLGVEDDAVLQDVELILYHTGYSILLDQNGEPTDLGGKFPYALLTPKPGSTMDRNLHLPGLYLSTGELADHQFKIDGRKIKKLLTGALGGFTESFATFTWPHEVQQQLQAYLRNRQPIVVAAITVKTPFSPGSLTLDALWTKMPILFDATLAYTAIEIEKRLKNRVEDYEEFLKQIGVEIVKSIVYDEIKSFLVKFLIKKIGAKVIPVVNFVSAIAEVFNDAEHEMVRAALTCVVLAIKGQVPDDMAISAKILAKIATDQVEAKIISVLVQKGAKVAKKGAKALAPKKAAPPATSTTPPADTPSAGQPASPSTGAGTDSSAKPPAQPAAQPGQGATKATGGKPYDVLKDTTAEEWEQAARMAQKAKQKDDKAGGKTQKKTDDKTDDKPDQKTKDAATTAKATGARTGDDKVDDPQVQQIAPGVYRRKGKTSGKDKPAGQTHTDDPNKHDPTDEQRSTSDTEQSARELRNRGTSDQHVDKREVDEVRRSRHIRERKQGNWDEGDSTVLAKNMTKGRGPNTGRPKPGEGYEAHHIIPSGEPESQELVKILATKGIGINEEFNGAWLPRGKAANVTGGYKHEFTFGARGPQNESEYAAYFTLLGGLVKKNDSADNIRGKIRTLGTFLEQGELPTYQQVIDQWKGK